MKKLFLSTTVLTMGLLTAGANAASAPKITIGGISDAQVAFVDQERITPITEQDVIFRNDNEIHFSIDGKTDGGLEYGAVIQLEADVGDEQNGSPNADRTYVYLQGAKWGRVEFGSNNTAADTLKLDADTFARGTGGIDGDTLYYNNTVVAFLRPDLFLGGYANNTERGDEVNKITYYTPNFNGFQAGVSYTPEYGNLGQDISGGAFVVDIISAAVRYEGSLDEIEFKIAGAVEVGDADNRFNPDYDNLMSWNVGGNVSFSGFTIGGSYTEFGNTFVYDWDYYTAGVSYANDQFGVGVGYFVFRTDDNYSNSNPIDYEYQNIVISADYNLASGIMPYAEVGFFEMDFDNSAYTSYDNQGTVFLLGTELTF